MTIYPVSSADFFYAGYTGQNAEEDSSAGFQLALEEQTSQTTERSGPVSLLDDSTYVTPNSISALMWDIDTRTALEKENEPQTLEEKQKALDVKSQELVTEFLTFSDMSPAEKLRARLLGEMDLSEEELAALPPEERARIEEEIKEAIRRALGIDETARSPGSAEEDTAMQAA